MKEKNRRKKEFPKIPSFLPQCKRKYEEKSANDQQDFAKIDAVCTQLSAQSKWLENKVGQIKRDLETEPLGSELGGKVLFLQQQIDAIQKEKQFDFAQISTKKNLQKKWPKKTK